MVLNGQKLNELQAHMAFKKPKSQEEYYIKYKSPEYILQYARISSGKTFGEQYMESIAKEYFKMDKRVSSTHDHIKNGKTIEQKSARYHANGSDWKWQHIELSHAWDFLLLTGLDIDCVRFYVAPRETVYQLIELRVITGQGKKDNPQQGYWFSRSDFKKNNLVFTDYFTELFGEQDLVNAMNNNK